MDVTQAKSLGTGNTGHHVGRILPNYFPVPDEFMSGSRLDQEKK
jgi:hypothetical protein